MTPLKFLKFSKNFLLHLALISLISEQFLFAAVSAARAADLPITPDGTTNTQFTKTASGIDQINIAAPSSDGLSRNAFTDYNINSSGQIINNFSGVGATAGSGSGAVVQTEIGGLVTVNQNLISSGSAKVILNEVTSNNVSNLRGYAEIAGTKAELILANPNGLICNGCGFINSSRLLMVAGSSNFDASGNLGFNLKEQSNPNLLVPLVTIEGLGLDVEKVSAAEIVASGIKLIGNIYGASNASFALKAGEGRYDYGSKNIVPNSGQQGGSGSALFAIDVSALTKIQAGQVFLIATKEGLGVNMAGEILAGDEVKIDANGDVYYSKISSQNKADLKSTKLIQSLDSSATITSPNLTIEANEFKNSATVLANNLTIRNSQKLTNFSEIKALNLTLSNIENINNSNLLYGENFLSISASNLTNSGLIFSPQNYTLSLSNLLTNSGEISSLGNLKIDGTAALNNSGKILANGELEISANSASNSDTIASLEKNLKITSNNFDNFGNILAKTKLDLVLGKTTNSGDIFSNEDLNLTLSDSLTNSGSISSLANLLFSSNSTITNSKEIISLGNLNLSATALTNSGEIKTGSKINESNVSQVGNLRLDLASLNNTKTIASSGTFTINASGDAANSGTLQSADNFIINAANLINQSLIISGKDLTVSASKIDNSNTKPANQIITSGLVASAGIISLNANSLNNDSGIIAAKSTNLNRLNGSGNVELSNSLGIFLATSSIILNLGNLNHTITGEITALNVDITANNITNLGKVTASDYIKLNATGSNGILGSGNIVNGYGENNILNQNVLLTAGSYIDLTAKNNINNYGNILATTDLTLTATSGNINNYASNSIGGLTVAGKIQAGLGSLTINALSGTLNNFNKTTIINNQPIVTGAALFSSNDKAIINVANFSNSGEISVKNDLTANIANNLNNNQSALIWSGKDLTLNVANNLINDRATIYSERNLTIQKNSSGEKTNLVQNISGDIETYGTYSQATNQVEGDLTIKASTLENKRSIDPGIWIIKPDRSNGAPYYYTWNDGQYDLLFTNHNLYSWNELGTRYFGNNEHQTQFRAAAPLNSNSVAANITSGASMFLESSSILNDVSNISSTRNLTINANSLVNQSKLYPEILYMRTSHRHHEYTDNANDFASDFTPFPLENDAYFSSLIKAGGSFYGSGFSNLRNITISPDYTKGSATKFKEAASSSTQVSANSRVSGADQIYKSTIINASDLYTLKESGVINIDLSKISSALGSITTESPTDTVLSGQFKINLTPNPNKPLVESRSQFTNATQFFGSDYFFNAIGINKTTLLRTIEQQTRQATNSIRILGDSVVETKLILDTIKKLTNDSLLLSKTTTDSNSQIKELLDDSISELTRLGISAEDVATGGLTKDQANSLTKDIITFETTKVNGISVLAPKLYLSQATKNRLLGSENNNSSLATNSTIFAGENLIIDAANADLLNAGSIISNNDMVLNLNNLTNKTDFFAKSQIKSGNNLTIATMGDIKNTNSNISSNKDLQLISNKDIINKDSANITSGNDATLIAQNNIKNLGSNITTTNDLSLTTLKGDIINTAIVATNDANLINQNPDSYIQNNMGLSYGSGNIRSNLIATSEIKAKNINISAANDFNNLAANLNSTENINISAGDDINIGTLQLRNRTEERWGGKKKGGYSISDVTTNLGSNINSSGSISIAANASGADSETSGNFLGSNVNITGSSLTSADNLSITAKDDITIQSAQDSSYSFSAGKSGRGKSYQNTSSSITQISSNLNTTNNGDIVIQSGVENLDEIGKENSKGSIALIASNLKTKDLDQNSSNNISSGNVNLIAKEDIVIASAINSFSQERSSSKKSSSSKTTTLNIDWEKKNISSNIDSNNNITLTSGDDSFIIASNLTALGDGKITTGKFVDSNDSTNISYNKDGALNIISATDEKFHYAMSQKISTDFKAVAVGMISAALVGAATGGIGAIAMATTSGAMIGYNAKKSKTSTELAYDAIQKSSELKFNNNLQIESGSDTNIISSNLAASQINVNIGKISDENNQLQIINENANLNIATIADIHVKESSVKKTHANYLAVAATSAAVAGVGAATGGVGNYAGNFISGPVLGNALYAAALVGTELSLVAPAAIASTEYSANSNSQITQTQVASNLTSQNDLTLLATKNLNVSGSNLVTDLPGGNINLTSEVGDVNIIFALENSSSSSSSKRLDFDDIGFSNTRSSVSLDFTQSGTESQSSTNLTTLVSSNIISSGSININSGSNLTDQPFGKGNLNLLASNLIANSDINLNTKGSLNIKSDQETQQILSSNSVLSNTLSAGIGNAILEAAFVARDTKESYQNSDDNTAGNATKAASSVSGVVAVLNAIITWGSFGFYANVTDRISKQTQESETEISQAKASKVMAIEGSITADSQRDINIKGSMIKSLQDDIKLIARNDLNIEASQSTINASSSFKSSSLTIPILTSLIALPTISLARSSSSLEQVINNNANLSADSGNLTLISLNDASIKGVNLSAKNILINTVKDLTIESLQDTKQFKSSGNSYSLGNNNGLGIDISKEDSSWTTNQTSIIGSNSVEINTGETTNLIGSLVANKVADKNGNLIDGNNLLLNTKNLTYSNLQDSQKSTIKSFNITVPISLGNNHKSDYSFDATLFSGTRFEQSFNMDFNLGIETNSESLAIDPKNTTISYNYSGQEQKQTTKATVGNGAILLNGEIKFDENGNLISIKNAELLNKNDQRISFLNRDITNSQELTQDREIGGYHLNNINVNGLQVTSDVMAEIPGTPIWVSRWVNDNNNLITESEVVDGKLVLKVIDYPAPNFSIGVGGRPNTGRGDDACYNSPLCNNTASDQSIPMEFLHNWVPSFRSNSGFHDAGRYNPDSLTTAATIPPYFLFNMYGAIGTLFDARNWDQNFIDPKTSIFDNFRDEQSQLILDLPEQAKN